MGAPAEEVRQWLTNDAKLERYFQHFIDHGYNTLLKCCCLGETSLDQLGIELPGHRKRLIGVSKKLQERLAAEGLLADEALQEEERDVCPPALPPKTKATSFVPEGEDTALSLPYQTGKNVEPDAPPKVMARGSSLKKSSSAKALERDRSPVATDCIGSSPSPFTDDPPPLPPKDGPPLSPKDGPPLSPKDGPPLSPRDGPPLPPKEGPSVSSSSTLSEVHVDGFSAMKLMPPSLPPKESPRSSPTPEKMADRLSSDSLPSPPVTPTRAGKPTPAPRQTSTKKHTIPVPTPRPRPNSVVESSSGRETTAMSGMSRHRSEEDILASASSEALFAQKTPFYYQQSASNQTPISQDESVWLPTASTQLPAGGSNEFQPVVPPPSRQPAAVSHSQSSQPLSSVSSLPPLPISVTPVQPEQPYAMLGQIFHGINPPSRDASLSPPPASNLISDQSNRSSIVSDQMASKPAGQPDDSNLYWIVSDKQPVALPTDKTSAGETGIYELLTGELPQKSFSASRNRQISTDRSSIHTKELQQQECVESSESVNRRIEPLSPSLPARSESTQLPSPSSVQKKGGPVLRHQTSLHMQPGCRVSVIQPPDTSKKSKEGYLFKQGGKDSNKGWTHRWVTFNSEELKYYRNKGDKDSEVLKTIPLKRMLNVTQEIDEKDKAHRYHFTLVTTDRSFLFASEKLDVCQVWSSTLLAAIMLYQPVEEDEIDEEGGKMHHPDMQGFLKKQGHSVLADWKQRYVALKGEAFCYYKTQDDWKHGVPIHEIKMQTSKVKALGEKHRFSIITPNKEYQFQAQSDEEMKRWIAASENAVLCGLQQFSHVTSTSTETTNAALESIRSNPANLFCADCGDKDPAWASVNLCITVCLKCSGVHRSMGVHISKVRSIDLDKHVWTAPVKRLFVELGNDRSNQLWLRHLRSSPPTPDVEDSVRDNFIRFKYENRAWCERTGLEDNEEELDKELCLNVATDDLIRTLQLIACGANVNARLPGAPEENCSPAQIARTANQELQLELLVQNGADPTGTETRALRRLNAPRSPQMPQKEFVTSVSSVSSTSSLSPAGGNRSHSSSSASSSLLSRTSSVLCGWLHKTGHNHTGWNRRWCVLEGKTLTYYKTERSQEEKGHVDSKELVSVLPAEEEMCRDSPTGFCFSTDTTFGRKFFFCADSKEEMDRWMDSIQQLIEKYSEGKKRYTKAGLLYKRGLNNTAWKHRWFTLSVVDKQLRYHKMEREESGVIDLRKVSEVKPPEEPKRRLTVSSRQASTSDGQLSFQIVTTERTYHLKANTVEEAESWSAAISGCIGRGAQLGNQTLSGSGIPLIVEKCVTFIEAHGMTTEGIYRHSGTRSIVEKLLSNMWQDPVAVVLDPNVYSVHDVTGTLKAFFRRLPDPLLTSAYYQAFLDAVQITDRDNKLYQLQSLVETLPPVNRETLKYLTGHLAKIAEMSEENKMTVDNLSVIFGPSLMTVDGQETGSFQTARLEWAVVAQIVSYYTWMFQIGEDELRQQNKLREALQKISAATSSATEVAKPATEFLVEIYINGRDRGDLHRMKVAAEMSSDKVVSECVRNKKLSGSSRWRLFQVTDDGDSERILHSSEKVLNVYMGFAENDYLCLKENYILRRMTEIGQCLTRAGVLTMKDCRGGQKRQSKTWKKHYCTFRDGWIIINKDAKQSLKGSTEAARWHIADCNLYIGMDQKKLLPPTRYGFHLKHKSEDSAKYFCFEDEGEMYRWICLLLHTKYPEGL